MDLASIDTGIGLRNRHMRDNYLEVEKYPYASFKGAIGAVQPSADGGGRVTASGTFTIHGVSREREITCDVTPVGEGYHASAPSVCSSPITTSRSPRSCS